MIIHVDKGINIIMEFFITCNKTEREGEGKEGIKFSPHAGFGTLLPALSSNSKTEPKIINK